MKYKILTHEENDNGGSCRITSNIFSQTTNKITDSGTVKKSV
jgi:hypothetical protein